MPDGVPPSVPVSYVPDKAIVPVFAEILVSGNVIAGPWSRMVSAGPGAMAPPSVIVVPKKVAGRAMTRRQRWSS